MPSSSRRQRTYDHRLRDLVRKTGDVTIAEEIGVPRSTAAGWLRQEPQEVVTVDVLDMDDLRLQREVLKLRKPLRLLVAVLRRLLTLVRISGLRLDGRRLPEGEATARVLRAIEIATTVLPLKSALRVVALSSARYHAWRRAEARCELDDRPGCPKTMPTRGSKASQQAVAAGGESGPRLSFMPNADIRVGGMNSRPTNCASAHKVTGERQALRPCFAPQAWAPEDVRIEHDGLPESLLARTLADGRMRQFGCAVEYSNRFVQKVRRNSSPWSR